MQVVKAGFDANYGLMTATPDGLAYPQPASTRVAQGHELLEFLGLMLGKALYEGILLDWPLAPFFVTKYALAHKIFVRALRWNRCGEDMAVQ
jgi:ubiquitin-protein ligase E3 C